MSTDCNTFVEKAGRTPRWLANKRRYRHAKSWRVNRMKKGIAHGRARMSLQHVQEMRVRWLLGETQTKLAGQYGYPVTVVNKMICGHSWGWLPWPKVDREAFVREVLGVGAKAANQGRDRLEGVA